MHIKVARQLVKWSMILSVVCAVSGLLFFKPGTQISLYITFAAFGLMVVTMILLFGYCRCPWCNKRITSGLMKVQVCPHCKRDLDTGLKPKGKNRRR